MKNRDKIKNALIAKGYTPATIEWEPIRYYSTGREGGWTISVIIDDSDHCFPDWSKINKPRDLIVDFFENDFMCYNITDALKAIDLLPNFDSNRTTYDD